MRYINRPKGTRTPATPQLLSERKNNASDGALALCDGGAGQVLAKSWPRFIRVLERRRGSCPEPLGSISRCSLTSPHQRGNPSNLEVQVEVEGPSFGAFFLSLSSA